MRYFFTPENKLPDGVGFSMFGPAHLGILAGLTLWSVLALWWFRRQRPARQNRVMAVLAWTMVVLEILKDFMLTVIGAFSIGYLPLHLCSLGMFVCLFYSAHPQSEGCGQILYSVCFPGALCALLFPDWTAFPLLHFQSIHSFFYHTLLVQFSLFPLVSGRVRLGLPAVWKGMAFLVAVSIPVGALNHLLGTNYMFLRRASGGSPLEFLAAIPGRFGYLLGYALLVLAVIFLLNAPFMLWNRFHGRGKGA